MVTAHVGGGDGYDNENLIGAFNDVLMMILLSA
jgi:hypothetical protein